ncbi:hypothetical protein OKW23_000214 [Bacilli bacterium PM5-9]|nr:hypothetical protein [Bacilli bacterium PM5-9]
MKNKKLLLALFMVFSLTILITNKIDAASTCSWNGYVKTCTICEFQSECHTETKTYYNTKWQKTKYTEKLIYGLNSFTKKITYNYDNYGYLKKRIIYKYFPTYNNENLTVKSKSTYKYQNSKITKRTTIKYRENKVIKEKANASYKNGVFNKKTIYRYNKKGQLKSNDNGNAYKIIRKYKKNGKKYKITSEKKYKYDKNGKLVKIK